MKIAKAIAKIVIALAAIAGIVYVAATYGDRIVAWCKKLLASLPCCKETEFVEEAADECAEEACCVCEEAPLEDTVEEAPAEEATVEDAVAEEADFEG